MLTKDESEVAAKRAERYPVGVPEESWGTGPLDREMSIAETREFIPKHKGVWRYG